MARAVARAAARTAARARAAAVEVAAAQAAVEEPLGVVMEEAFCAGRNRRSRCRTHTLVASQRLL